MSALRKVRAALGDLGLGVRLAIGGSRTPWGRLVLTAVGIGLGVAVLLLAASVQNMVQARDMRESLREKPRTVHAWEAPSDAKLLTSQEWTSFRGRTIQGQKLQVLQPGAPLPPGVDRLPQPGEIVVSPELARVLTGPDGKLLAPRLPGRITGTIRDEGLSTPNELYYYAGTGGLDVHDPVTAAVVTGYGNPVQSGSLSPDAWMVLALGVSALLVPVVVFVASTTRLAEAARERRLAALRLVGADGGQVRRIASGEALVGALAGVLVGWAVFLTGREIAGHVSLVGFTTFSADIWPAWWYALTISALVPAIAVVTARIAMRRTIIEPLGVVRRTEARPRKAVWRFAPLVAGALGLAALKAGGSATSHYQTPFVACIVVMLIGVPLVLPWVVERVVRRLGAGPLPWQLAVRRLQVTSGTAARSVSAIAVVVTGVIGLQTALATAEADRYEPGSGSHQPGQENTWSAFGTPRQDSALADFTREASAVPGVADVTTVVHVTMDDHAGKARTVLVADCATLLKIARMQHCQDGDAFSDASQGEPLPHGGEVWKVISSTPDTVSWHVPEKLIPADSSAGAYHEVGESVLVTPRAAEGIPLWARQMNARLRHTPDASPDAIELVRNAAAAHVESSSVSESNGLREDDGYRVLRLIRYGLLLGALVTFALIACGVFVSAAEQIQERRRPIATLAAVGVPKRILGWSALLQNLVPMLAAVAVAIVVGLALGVLVAWSSSLGTLTFDVSGMAGLAGIALLSVLVVTGLTIPALGRAMHPEGLRTE